MFKRSSLAARRVAESLRRELDAIAEAYGAGFAGKARATRDLDALDGLETRLKGSRRLYVLLAEDNPINRELVDYLLAHGAQPWRSLPHDPHLTPAMLAVKLNSPLADTLAGPRVAATRSVFYPGSERALGWDISETGFKIVLSAEVPDLARRFLGGDVDAFLATQGLTRADIASWICHPGGPKVLEAMQEALEITEEDLAVTWTSLRQVGNLSSASVLHILGEILDEHRPPPTLDLRHHLPEAAADGAEVLQPLLGGAQHHRALLAR